MCGIFLSFSYDYSATLKKAEVYKNDPSYGKKTYISNGGDLSALLLSQAFTLAVRSERKIMAISHNDYNSI